MTCCVNAMSGMKNYHCSVPGCTTYDKSNYFLKLPENSSLRSEWLSKIPRKEWLIDASARVCTKHFNQGDFKLATSVVKSGVGKEFVTKWLVPVNSNTMIPSVVPKTCVTPIGRDPNRYSPDFMFMLPPRDNTAPQIFKDLEQVGADDFIINYLYLKGMFAKRLKIHLNSKWIAKVDVNCLVLYIGNFDDIPRILVSIKIDTNLKVTVSLANRFIDPIDLNWVLPATSKLNRWSQLDAMLTLYGNNN